MIFEYTYKNHLQIYSDHNSFPHCKYTQPITDILDIKEATYRGAKLLAENLKNENVYICFSGGSDSYVIAKCFFEQDLPFTAAIAKINYKSHSFINEREASLALSFCTDNNISYELFEINLDEIWQREYLLKVATENNFHEAEYVYFHHLLSLVSAKGCPIFGGGDPVIEFYRKNTVKVNEYESFYALVYHRVRSIDLFLHRFLEKNNIKGTTWFHSYTPEQIFSFLYYYCNAKLQCIVNFLIYLIVVNIQDLSFYMSIIRI